jgi:hypothetical protein
MHVWRFVLCLPLNPVAMRACDVAAFVVIALGAFTIVRQLPLNRCVLCWIRSCRPGDNTTETTYRKFVAAHLQLVTQCLLQLMLRTVGFAALGHLLRVHLRAPGDRLLWPAACTC